jgi:hypothetical protein
LYEPVTATPPCAINGNEIDVKVLPANAIATSADAANHFDMLCSFLQATDPFGSIELTAPVSASPPLGKAQMPTCQGHMGHHERPVVPAPNELGFEGESTPLPSKREARLTSLSRSTIYDWIVPAWSVAVEVRLAGRLFREGVRQHVRRRLFMAAAGGQSCA